MAKLVSLRSKETQEPCCKLLFAAVRDANEFKRTRKVNTRLRRYKCAGGGTNATYLDDREVLQRSTFPLL